jgi:drug/metabolite transporter (DMT)-like permease
MGAAACYSASSILTRKLAHIPPLLSSSAVLTTAACYMVPLALLNDPVRALPLHIESFVALGFLGLVSTAFAYFLRFQLILRVGVVFVSQVSYLVPLFAVLWGWLLLAETPTISIWVALGLILMGINVSRLGAISKAAALENDQ